LRDILKYQFPPLAWIILVYILSSIPDFPLSEKLPTGSDKIGHAITFSVLCWLAKRAFYEQRVFAALHKNAMLGAILFSCAYALLDEFHRNFLPGHSPDNYRLVADAAGVLLYAAMSFIFPRQRNGNRSESES
jgi:VanZ family protein